LKITFVPTHISLPRFKILENDSTAVFETNSFDSKYGRRYQYYVYNGEKAIKYTI